LVKTEKLLQYILIVNRINEQFSYSFVHTGFSSCPTLTGKIFKVEKTLKMREFVREFARVNPGKVQKNYHAEQLFHAEILSLFQTVEI
jgi:hypothetical protein